MSKNKAIRIKQYLKRHNEPMKRNCSIEVIYTLNTTNTISKSSIVRIANLRESDINKFIPNII